MNQLLRKLPITRIKLYLARMLFGVVKPFYGTDKRIIKRNGLSFEVDLTEGLDLSLFLFGNFQKHVSENKFIDLPSDAVILDIGANVGIMSLKFAQKVPEGKVFAFEPTHYAYQKLQRNLELNPFIQNIEVIQSFVTDSKKSNDGLFAFSSWKIDKKPASDQHPIHGGKAMSTEGIPAITIDEIAKSKSLDRIDFIKIDTDGHEFEVLSGAKKSIELLRPKIIFELGQYVMEEKNITFMDYHEFFIQLNYKLFNAASNKTITLSNYKRMIPQKGTIDILAIPD